MRRHDHLFKGTRKILTNSVVVTSGPITADAATAKVVGIKKSITVSASATNKVTGLSKAEKNIVKVTKKGKKFTIKGLKAGKATFKIGKKSYTVKVGATTVKAAKTKLTLTKGKEATLKFTAKSGNGDTLTFKASNKNVTLAKKSAKIAKNVASVTATAKKAGKTTITATSKATGKKATVTVTVKNPAKPATTTPGASNTPVATATGSATNTPEATATATATASGSATNTPDVTATPVATATGTATATPVATGSATNTPEATEVPTEAPTKAPEVVTGGTITISGAAVTGAAVSVVSGTTVVYTGTVEGLATTKFEAGTYVITVSKDGYEKVTATAVVADGKDTVVDAVLTKIVTAAVSADAVNAKTIGVKFNKVLTKEEQEKIKVSVKKSNASQSVVTKFNDGVLEITRSAATAWEAGTYTVEVAGLEKTATFTVEIAAQAAKTLDVTSSVVSYNKANAPVNVVLKDQYGETMQLNKADFVITVYNQTQGKSLDDSIVSVDATSKNFVIDTTAISNFKLDDVVKVNFFHKASGLQKTVELKVVVSSYLKTISLSDIVLPTGKTLLTQDLTNIKIPYTAQNQYGDSVEATKGGNVTVLVDGSVIADADVTFEKETSGATYIKVAKFLKAGTGKITIVNNVTGEATVKEITVAEKAGVPYEISVDSSTAEVAKGSIKYFDVTVLDKYGNKIDAKDYINAITIASSNTDVVTNENVKFVSDPSDANYGKISVQPTGNADTTAIITATVKNTNKAATIAIKVGAEAKANAFVVSNSFDKTLLPEANTTMKFKVSDQYGADMTNAASPKYYFTAEVNENSKDYISLENADLNKANVAEQKLVVSAKKAGTATITVKLYKNSTDATNKANVIATTEYTFTVESNSSKNLTYSVNDVASLYKGGATANCDGSHTFKSGSATEVKANTYPQKVELTGTKSDGTKIAIPQAKILNVTPSNENVVVKKIAGQWYVAGDATISDNKDVTSTLTVLVSTDEGTKTLTKNVTVSAVAPKTVKLQLMDKAVGATDAKEVTAIKTNKYAGDILFNTDTLTSAINTNHAYIWAVDQFGIATEYDALANNVSASGFTNITGVVADTAVKCDTFTGGTSQVTVTEKGDDTVAAKDSSYRLTIIKDGLALDVPVLITAAQDLEKPYITVAKLSADKKVITLTFNEALKDDTDTSKFTVTDSGSATKESFSISTDKKTVTITLDSAATAGVKVVSTAKDAADNEILAAKAAATFATFAETGETTGTIGAAN